MKFPDPLMQHSLSREEILSAVRLLLCAEISEEVKGTFLSALNQRGETAGELAGFASVLLEEAVRPEIFRDESSPLMELCGTGGDSAGLLNISTAAMFVVAGAGVRVVKHGNRAVSSRCGSADVLEALGVALHLKRDRVHTVLEQAGCVFLLASDFHPAVAAVAPLRRALAARGQMTVFNLLGPLLNPAMPDFQLTGVYAPGLLDLYAEALGLLGRRAAWAVHGKDATGEEGFDELSLVGPSLVAAYRKGRVERLTIDPRELGWGKVESPQLLLGGDAVTNAARIAAILSGAETGAARDMIVLNAAAALHVAGQAVTLQEGIALAGESINCGAAARSLEQLRKASASAAALF
jgi:anthranilate phosphoribosyltransferase